MKTGIMILTGLIMAAFICGCASLKELVNAREAQTARCDCAKVRCYPPWDTYCDKMGESCATRKD